MSLLFIKTGHMMKRSSADYGYKSEITSIIAKKAFKRAEIIIASIKVY